LWRSSSWRGTGRFRRHSSRPHHPPALGLGGIYIVLLVLTFIVTVLTVVPGRATLQAGVHLALLAAYLFLAISP